MYIDYELLLSHIPDDAVVLDLGGAERVFPRANYVADLLPYEKRKIVYPEKKECFTKDSWMVEDFTSRIFWERFKDKEFDFIIISHTLEDIRDPIYVIEQMIRCSRAGYIEVPSKFRECSKLTHDDSFAGYDHHRWIVEYDKMNSSMVFKAKLSWAHTEDYLKNENRHILNDYFYHFDGYFWEDNFNYIEYFPKGSKKETEDLKVYFQKIINNYGKKQRENIFYLKSDLQYENRGKCIWIDGYLMESEKKAENIMLELNDNFDLTQEYIICKLPDSDSLIAVQNNKKYAIASWGWIEENCLDKPIMTISLIKFNSFDNSNIVLE